MPPATRARRPDKPAPIGLNLDALKREGAITEPFAVVLNAHRYELSDPNEFDWQELAACMADPRLMIRMGMTTDAAAEFLAEKVPAWKINALAEAWAEHYGLNPADLGEGDASPT